MTAKHWRASHWVISSLSLFHGIIISACFIAIADRFTIKCFELIEESHRSCELWLHPGLYSFCSQLDHYEMHIRAHHSVSESAHTEINTFNHPISNHQESIEQPLQYREMRKILGVPACVLAITTTAGSVEDPRSVQYNVTPTAHTKTNDNDQQSEDLYLMKENFTIANMRGRGPDCYRKMEVESAASVKRIEEEKLEYINLDDPSMEKFKISDLGNTCTLDGHHYEGRKLYGGQGKEKGTTPLAIWREEKPAEWEYIANFDGSMPGNEFYLMIDQKGIHVECVPAVSQSSKIKNDGWQYVNHTDPAFTDAKEWESRRKCPVGNKGEGTIMYEATNAKTQKKEEVKAFAKVAAVVDAHWEKVEEKVPEGILEQASQTFNTFKDTVMAYIH